MRRLVTPTLQMTIGLLSMTLSLIFIAYSLGLIPNENDMVLEARRVISESLAVQLASLASRNDVTAISETISSVAGRNSDVLSIAVRGADGKTIAASTNHEALWVEPVDGKSTPTHVQIALLNADVAQGRIEIAFRPLREQPNVFGLSRLMTAFIAFMCIAGFTGYFFILSRALRELDPGHAIPERVKAAFDTLVEGVLILDEGEHVLLANDTFANRIHADPHSHIGIKASELPWIQEANVAATSEFPWQAAMRKQARIVGMPLGIRDRLGVVHRLIVNATPILDGKGVARGVIATFDDVTLLHQKNEQLHDSIDELTRSQLKISEQNQQLQILASTDPLTKCLNRRTFFAKAEAALQNARSQRQPMAFLMLDVDHFKKINDRFGHAVGDKVLIGLVDVLQRNCRGHDLVGRYGGEEFCIAVAGLAERDTEGMAEQFRQAISDVTTWLPGGERVTISIGIASTTDDASPGIADLVKSADEALYAAKKSGRNRFVNRRKMPVLPQATEADTGHDRDSVTPADQRQPRVETTDPKLFSRAQRRNTAAEHIEAIMRENRAGVGFAMALIDIDKFRHFNNCYGHDASNALLDELEGRIARRLRHDDLLVRLGSDEFLLLLGSLDSPEKGQPVVDELLTELKRPIFIGRDEICCSCSIGISLYPEHGRDYETLRRCADTALYQAKQVARGEAVFFNIEMSEVMVARREAEQQLRIAVHTGKLCCAFQPKVDIADCRVVGFEALVRWRGDDGTIHPPMDFIELAVELGLIGEITNFVLDTVVKSFYQLDSAFGSGTSVSINIASSLANDKQFMIPFTNALKHSGYSSRIMLELTEESFIERGRFQSDIISGLREIGVRISIDDFGTGYSSLSMLAEITADEIKIDRSLIFGIHRRIRNQSILRAIGSLGRALNMSVVAEGVETYEELAYIHAIASIRLVQGHYFSRPFYLEDISGARSIFVEEISAEATRTQSHERSTA